MRIVNNITRKERLIWIAVTVFLAGFILLVSLAPAVVAQGATFEDQKALQKFNEIYYYIKDYYVDAEKTDATSLINGALEGLFNSLDDPYSAYITEEALRDLEDTSTGSFGGVGLVISKQRLFNDKGALIENTPIEVVSPIEGTPAYKAGVNAGDLIIKVEGDSTLDMSLDEVVDRLRGTPGSKVTMTVRRGESLEFNVTVVRSNIEIPTVKHAIINNTIGYIKIIEFTSYTPARIKEVLQEFTDKGVKSLVIDVRSNPGGVLTSVITIADYFLSEGIIVSVKGRVAVDNVEYTAKKNNDLVPRTMPMVLLVDRGSASASEILAGALKDNNRATVIGETSYGKGTVQHVKLIGDSGFKLTVAKFYSPSGDTIDKVGVTPNIVIKEEEYSDSERQAYETIIKENLISDFVAKNPHPSERDINAFIAGLKKRGLVLREIALKRLIFREVYRTSNNPPAFDLATDPVLEKAVQVISGK
ncbi:MAG TPA: S41 family peptidase [Spirochaetia bacterium]|nr:S41 family peptidase [Spirochaetia bacterium]